MFLIDRAIVMLLASLLFTPLFAAVASDDWKEINNVLWKLDSIPDHEDAAVDRIEVTIQFLQEDHRVAGTGGCNRYFGESRLSDGGKLHLGPFGTTMMACPEEAMDLERLYLQQLDKVRAFRLTEAGELELLDESDEVVLVFVRP